MKRLNPFIYDTCADKEVRHPDIPVFERTYFGQCAEDLIVVSLLRAFSSRAGIDLTQARYLEIGANHPISTSATYLLHTGLGMTGVLVEANEALIPDLERIRPADVILHAAVTDKDVDSIELYISHQDEISSLSKDFVESWQDGNVGIADVRSVPAKRINAILETYFQQEAPLFLSVDVEGVDLEILKDLDWNRWRPYIVQTEPSDQFNPDSSNHMEAFLEEHDYIVVCRTDVNIIALDRLELVRRTQDTSETQTWFSRTRARLHNSFTPAKFSFLSS